MKTTITRGKLHIDFNIGKYAFFLHFAQRPLIPTVGLTNETEDNYFVPFIDWDNILYEKVLKDIKHIQKVFDTGTIVVLKSFEETDVEGRICGNYMGIGFAKLTFWEHYDMLRHTRCDIHYLRIPNAYKFKNWVLRVAKKGDRVAPELKSVQYSETSKVCSYAHLLGASSIYNIDAENILKQGKWDGNTAMDIVSYMTQRGKIL